MDLRPKPKFQITDRTLSTLIPAMPMMIEWLRNCTESTADLLMQSFEEDTENAEKALKDIMKSSRRENSDLTMAQLQEIGARYKATTWAKALTLVMTRSSPRLMSNELGASLIATLPQLHGATSVKEVCHILGPILDQMSRKNYEALAVFCAMVRDTASDTKPIAMLVGPTLLIPLISLQDDFELTGSVMAAAALMDLLFHEAEALFGRLAGTRIQYPFGPSRQAEPFNATFFNFRNDQGLVRRSLRAFYDWRDHAKSQQVDILFKLYKFEVIAMAVFDKYGMLPAGWSDELKRQGIKDMSKIEGWGIVLKNELVKSGADLVIDELAITEVAYFKKLNSFIEYYAKPIVEIASGLKGAVEQSALGLTEQEAIEIGGGEYLEDVRDATNKLIAKLDVVTLIQARPLTVDGRVGLLLDVFEQMLPELECYIPYILRYTESRNTIDEATKNLEKSGKGKKKNKVKAKNFLKIWEIVSTSHPLLSGKSLDSVLIEPIQRPPRYLILFKSLRSQVDEKHPRLPAIDAMIEKLDLFNKQIDTTLDQQERSHAKLKNMLGIDKLPKGPSKKVMKSGSKGSKKKNR